MRRDVRRSRLLAPAGPKPGGRGVGLVQRKLVVALSRSTVSKHVAMVRATELRRSQFRVRGSAAIKRQLKSHTVSSGSLVSATLWAGHNQLSERSPRQFRAEGIDST